MNAPDPQPKIELDQIMLAMDVVDTLRHQQSVVERELNADHQDQALIEKVRRMYAEQGIAVTDETIAAGVAALRENRFTYRPPDAGARLWLAKLYVQRGKWAKRLGVMLALVLVLALGYRWIFVAPAARRLKQSATDVSDRIRTQNDRLKTTVVRFQTLQKSLADQRSAETAAAPGVAPLLETAATLLAKALEGFKALEQLPPANTLTATDVQAEIKQRTQRLNQRRDQLLGIDQALDKTDAILASVGQLRNMPAKLEGLYAQVKGEAREQKALQQAQDFYRQGQAALQQADLQAVQAAQAGLHTIYQKLLQSYELRIVSRPGVSSGVWRYPQNNQKARNYYLVVEAVTPQGRKLTLPITNEENGRLEKVAQWGLRVSEQVFEDVRRDKQDDGIIQKARVGLKKRGYLTPQYAIPTSGGAITQW